MHRRLLVLPSPHAVFDLVCAYLPAAAGWGVFMKIFYVSRRYPPYIGGAQTQLQVLAKKVAEENDVDVAILSDSTEVQSAPLHWILRILQALWLKSHVIECLGVVGRRFSDANVRVNVVGFSRLEKLLILLSNGLLADAIIERKFLELMRGADAVHCVKPDWFSRAASRAARKLNIPVAVAPYIHEKTVSKDVKFLLMSADVVFSLSETDKSVLADIGVAPERIKRMGVTPLISLNGNPFAFRERHDLGDNPIVLFVGRLVEYKGALAILRAAEMVWRAVPSAQFVFAGPQGEDALSWFHQFADPRIKYLGVISEEEKADAIAACDILCMPSNYEILPAVYLEAWSYGKPVIGGMAHGLKELIEDNGAGFISSHEPAVLAETLKRLLVDDELRRRMGQAGYRLVNNEFGAEVIAGRMTSAYAEALGQRSYLRLQAAE